MSFLRIIVIAALLPVACTAVALGQSPTLRTISPSASPDRELVVATKEAPPFAMKAADGRWQGISIDLWHRIADQLHLHYQFVELVTVQDLLAATSSGGADAAVAAITVTAARSTTNDFTQP